jgi:Lon protease-like protein
MIPVALPEVIPVFPLSGCILLPGNWLPLHIFEPRYRNLVADARSGDGLIGMVQPGVPDLDNWGVSLLPGKVPELCAIGGVGRIERCQPEPDGRFHILLRGISRFRLERELPLHRGYRRFEVTFADFAGDGGEPERVLDPGPLLEAMRVLQTSHHLAIDADDFRHLPGVAIVNGLSAALPFTAAEKQALLEAVDVKRRESLLLALMTLGFDPNSGRIPPPASTVH